MVFETLEACSQAVGYFFLSISQALSVKQKDSKDPGTENGHVDVTETTPLLAAGHGDIAPATDPESSEAVTLNDQSDCDADSDDDKPLPVTQILVLCYARWVEPVAFFSIFPYINKMAQKNGNLADADVGFYSGLIESLFSLTQMLVMILWGKASDRFGRKPVLVFSLVGVTCATALFGMATTLWEMILFRCLAGVFAGTIVTIRTMLSEHSTPKTQARAFSWFSFTGNMGILFGPVLGGALAEPASQYPRLFKDIQFFVDYPYALPSFAVSCIGISAVVVTVLFTEETLKRDNTTSSPSPSSTFPDSESPIPSKPAAMTMYQLLNSPGVPVVLYTYAHIMLLAFAYTAIAPLFMFTRVDLGGFDFEPLQISFFMALNGLAQAIWVLIIFPPLQLRIGTNGVIRACAIAYPFWFCIQPIFNSLLRNGDPVLIKVFWIFAPIGMCIGCGVSMSFTAIQLALNEVSPSPLYLGTLNSIALSIISGVRAFSPALFTTLFAVSVNNQWLLWGYSIWVLLVCLALGLVVVVKYLPDTEQLRRERERKRDSEVVR